MSVDAIRLDSSPAAHFVPATPKLWALLVEAGFDPPTGSGECIEFYRPGVAHHGEFAPSGRFIPSRPTVRVVRTGDHSFRVLAIAECWEADFHNAPAVVVLAAVRPALATARQAADPVGSSRPVGG